MTQYFQDADLHDPTVAVNSSPPRCHTFEGNALEARARHVQEEYCRAAKTYDSTHHLGTTTYDRLISFGPVKGFVVGPRGEFSKDLKKLIKKAAASAAYKHWDSMGAKDFSIARARYLRLFTKTLAVAAIREQAILIRNTADACLMAQRPAMWSSSDAARMHR